MRYIILLLVSLNVNANIDCDGEKLFKQFIDDEYNMVHTQSMILSTGNQLCDIHKDLKIYAKLMYINAKSHERTLLYLNTNCETKHNIEKWSFIKMKMGSLQKIIKRECEG